MPITNPDYSDLDYEAMAKEIGLKSKHIPLLIASFLEESQPILANLEAAILATEYENIKALAHSIKGSAGNLRFAEVYEMAKEMEHAGASADATFEYTPYLKAIKKAVATIQA